MLSKKETAISVDFDSINELVKEINNSLQNSTFADRQYNQKLLLKNKFKVDKKDNFCENNYGEADKIEQDVVENIKKYQ